MEEVQAALWAPSGLCSLITKVSTSTGSEQNPLSSYTLNTLDDFPYRQDDWGCPGKGTKILPKNRRFFFPSCNISAQWTMHINRSHYSICWVLKLLTLLCICVLSNLGLLRWLNGKESSCQCTKLGCGFNPWAEKISRRRKWQPTPVSLPGKSHGQRGLVGYSPWGRKRVGHDLATKQQLSSLTVGHFQNQNLHKIYEKSASVTWNDYRLRDMCCDWGGKTQWNEMKSAFYRQIEIRHVYVPWRCVRICISCKILNAGGCRTVENCFTLGTILGT